MHLNDKEAENTYSKPPELRCVPKAGKKMNGTSFSHSSCMTVRDHLSVTRSFTYILYMWSHTSDSQLFVQPCLMTSPQHCSPTFECVRGWNPKHAPMGRKSESCVCARVCFTSPTKGMVYVSAVEGVNTDKSTHTQTHTWRTSPSSFYSRVYLSDTNVL